MQIHFEVLAIAESVALVSITRDFGASILQPAIGFFSENSPTLVKHTLETILNALEQEPRITEFSLSSARAVGILNRTQKCPEEAREVLQKIIDPNNQVSYRFHSDESLRRQCQQKLLAAGGRVLESWTLLERLYLSRMENTVNFADISSQVDYPVNSLLELSRRDVNRFFSSNETSQAFESVECTPISRQSPFEDSSMNLDGFRSSQYSPQ